MNLGYFTNFIVYAFAMSGVLLTAVFVYKKCCTMTPTKDENKFLKVKDRICIAPRKNLYVVQAGSEYFLIAGDAERTTMLSKLNDSNEQTNKSTNYPAPTHWGEEFSTENKKVIQRLNERFKI